MRINANETPGHVMKGPIETNVSGGLDVWMMRVDAVMHHSKTVFRFPLQVPDYVVRGMQLGLGLKLAQKGLQAVLYSDEAPTEFRDTLGLDGWLLGTAAVAFLLISDHAERG